MATFETIHAEAKLYPEPRYHALVNRTGGAVTGSTCGTWIEDRSTGIVFLRSEKDYAPGATVQLKCHIRLESSIVTPTVVHFRVLRPVPIQEVRELAAKYGGARPLPIRAGKWYQVLTD
jgi:hypothetical protein